jgi:hypothetical protein
VAVAEFVVGERGQEVRFNDCYIADSRSYPGEDIPERVESSGGAALGEADGRAGITDLGGACRFRVECCQRGPGLAELPEPGMGGQPPARQLMR